MMWDTLTAVGDKLAIVCEAAGDEGPSTDELYKLAQAQATAVNSYAKLVEIGELEERLDALEQAQGRRAA